MNALPSHDRRTAHAAFPHGAILSRVVEARPQIQTVLLFPNDPGFARWYERQEMLDANEPEIPADPN